MAYMHGMPLAESSGLGCGAGCGCRSCGSHSARLGEPPAARQLTRVPHASVGPWRAVCRIEARQDDRGVSIGSGVYITAVHVLTCAHVILPLQAPNTRAITVHPGQNGADADTPSFKAVRWEVSPRWRASDCMTAGEDYGLILMPPQNGFIPTIPFLPADLLGAVVTIAGFPASQETRARHMYTAQGRVLGGILLSSCTAETAEGRLLPNIPAATNLIAHDIQTGGSMSGSPIWFTKDTRRLAAIHTGRIDNQTKGKAIILNDTVRAQIRHWMQTTLAAPARRPVPAPVRTPAGAAR
ncbi:MAG TPA: trypsin-like peptidase domain-containing protein [Vicinamibacterales bacterium]|nr:trypsin-like peptidase domain-containing protein [Vicinamibacterales bacterium]